MNKNINSEKNKYRENLPPIPERLLKLPVERQYPVPWFVAEIDGHYDFRVVGAGKLETAVNNKLCWICGERLGSVLVFAIGPMCAVNRVTSEPPSHRECAEFAAKACPFLIQQQTRYRETDMPENASEPAGIGIKRQPGVALLWLTKSYKPFKAPGGVLFRIGEPIELFWYRQGRAATREEILHSIETGLPILREMATVDGRMAELQLEQQITKAMNLVPPEIIVKKPKFGVAAKANR